MQNDNWLIDFHVIEKENRELALQQKYNSPHCLDAKLNNIKALKRGFYNMNVIQNILNNKSSYKVLSSMFNEVNVMKTNVNKENILHVADFGRIFHIIEANWKDILPILDPNTINVCYIVAKDKVKRLTDGSLHMFTWL